MAGKSSSLATQNDFGDLEAGPSKSRDGQKYSSYFLAMTVLTNLGWTLHL